MTNVPSSALFDDDLAEMFGLPPEPIRARWYRSFLDGHGLATGRRPGLIDRAAGAITPGRTNVPEFAAGSHTFNPVFGATPSPGGDLTGFRECDKGPGPMGTSAPALAESVR